MVFISFQEKVRIPSGIKTLEAFRHWARSKDFPKQGRFAFLRGELWVDISMEQAYTHNRVKTRINSVLDELATSGDLGDYFSDGMFLSNPAVDLSTVPDGLFISYQGLQEGRVRLLEGAEEGFVELEGAPDMVLEVVSENSVHKDTVLLRRLYWQAGIPEYWLVDARGEVMRFDILRRGSRKYVPVRGQGGWYKSQVFGHSFQFTRRTSPVGNPQYNLAVRP